MTKARHAATSRVGRVKHVETLNDRTMRGSAEKESGGFVPNQTKTRDLHRSVWGVQPGWNDCEKQIQYNTIGTVRFYN